MATIIKKHDVILIRADAPCPYCTATATTFLYKNNNNPGSATRTCACNIGKGVKHFNPEELTELLTNYADPRYLLDEAIYCRRRIEDSCKAKIPPALLWIFEKETIDDTIVLRFAAAAFSQRLHTTPHLWHKLLNQPRAETAQQTLEEYSLIPCNQCKHETGAHDKRGFCTVCKKFCD